MASKKTVIGLALGSAFAAGMASTAANAVDNPFAVKSLDRGYMVAAVGMDGKCGQGKCGMAAMMDANKDGKVSKEEFMKAHESIFDLKDANKDGVLSGTELNPGVPGMEGKCGQGKCGAARPAAPAKATDGKCGQGKCGAMR